MSANWKLAPSDAEKYNSANGYYYKGKRPNLLVHIDGGWTDSALMARNEKFVYRPAKPKPWSGPEDGLPPVGTVCEFAGGTECPEDPFDKDLKEGMKATIIAHFKCGDFTLAAFTFDPENPDRGMVQVEQATFGCFRPIRTPEQLAAEERERTRKIGVAQMMEHIHFSLPKELWGECEPACYALYDAGFKREVART